MYRHLTAWVASLLSLAPSVALAHGSEELAIFAYLLEESGFFRLSASFLGALIFLLGAFIAWQGTLEYRRLREQREEAPPSPLPLILPGGVLAAVGVAILLAAAFILPDRIDTGAHDHPVGAARSNERNGGVRTERRK